MEIPWNHGLINLFLKNMSKHISQYTFYSVPLTSRSHHSFRGINTDHLATGKKARDHLGILSITPPQIQNPFNTIQRRLGNDSGPPLPLVGRTLFIFLAVKFVCHIYSLSSNVTNNITYPYSKILINITVKEELFGRNIIT